MTWTIVSPPAPDSTAIDAFRAQVREASTLFDSELTAKLTAAIVFLQANANVQYYRAAAQYRADHFPGYRGGSRYYHLTLGSLETTSARDAPFYLPPSPLVSVEDVAYVDTEGNNQTLDPAKYEVITDEKPGFIRPVKNEIWPAADSVLVDYTVGWGTLWADIPPNQTESALVLAEWYYRDASGIDEEDLRRLVSTVSVGDEFHSYL